MLIEKLIRHYRYLIVVSDDLQMKIANGEGIRRQEKLADYLDWQDGWLWRFPGAWKRGKTASLQHQGGTEKNLVRGKSGKLPAISKRMK